LPLIAPLVDVMLLYGLLFLDPVRTLVAWTAIQLIQMLGGAYAFRLDGERLRVLWLMPVQQFVYARSCTASCCIRWPRPSRAYTSGGTSCAASGDSNS
jgi:hypothetical protein